MRLIALALLLCCSGVVAQTEMTLLSGFVSWHQNRCKVTQSVPLAIGGGSVVGAPLMGTTRSECLNQNNVGIGLRIDSGEWKNYVLGIYQNSYNQSSVYVAKEFLMQMYGPIHAGLLVGAVTGYKYAIVPWVAPELVTKFNGYEVVLLAQPFGNNQVAALQVRIKF